MNLKSIGKRLMRTATQRTVNRAKNKIVTKTTNTILKQLPQTKDPLLTRAKTRMTRQTVRTMADLIIGYTRDWVQKEAGRKSKIKYVLVGAVFLPLTAWGNVTITTPATTVFVTAEIADEQSEWERGLMFRTQLADNAGMLFIFDKVGSITMWMKNTYIPLDMIFFDETGSIVSIAKNTIPFDKTFIYSGAPALGVLEVNAGFADQHNITAGDKITYTRP